MKRFITILFACTLVFTSCSNDDEASDISGDIVGTWIGTDLTYEGTLETTIYGLPVNGTFSGDAYDITSVLTFSESPNTLVSTGNYSVEITYTIAGITETETVEDLEFLENSSWEISGNELILDNSDEDTLVTIYTLTDDKLVIGIASVETIEENGELVTTKIKAIATFKR